MIALLSLLFFLYYRNLEETANSTVISALDWSTKLVPQTIRIIYIAFWSTVIVILVAVPLGIMLTRPALRRISPFILGVANSGQALPAYGLLVIFLGIMGQGKEPSSWRSRSTPCCPCCATRWSASTGSTAP